MKSANAGNIIGISLGYIYYGYMIHLIIQNGGIALGYFFSHIPSSKPTKVGKYRGVSISCLDMVYIDGGFSRFISWVNSNNFSL